VIDLDPQRSVTRWSKQNKDFSLHVFSLDLDVKNPAIKFKHDLDKLIAATNSNVVLIDAPPQLQDAALLSALISDLILIPVTPSPLDIWAAEAAVETGREARQERGGKKPKIVLVPSRIQTGTVLGRELSDTLAALGEAVAPGISQRVALVESAITGQTIEQYAPKSPSHSEFKQLAKYVLDIMGGKKHGSKR
jgi:chromosome partitioning protein